MPHGYDSPELYQKKLGDVQYSAQKDLQIRQVAKGKGGNRLEVLVEELMGIVSVSGCCVRVCTQGIAGILFETTKTTKFNEK